MSKSNQWPAEHGRLKKYLSTTDKVYFRKITENGIPESVGTGNAGKSCTLIIGMKEIESCQKVGKFRGREEFAGLSVEISDLDDVYSSKIDSRGYPASLGLPNVGKDVTIIVQK